MLGYENITQLSNSLYLIGTTDGYYTVNLDDLNFNTYKISMANIVVNSSNGNENYASLGSVRLLILLKTISLFHTPFLNLINTLMPIISFC